MKLRGQQQAINLVIVVGNLLKNLKYTYCGC